MGEGFMDIYDRHQLHLHVMFLDGVFPRSKDDVKFSEHRAMSQESRFDVIEMIYLRPAKLFENKGFVMDSGEATVPDDVDSDAPRPFRLRALKASPGGGACGSFYASTQTLAASVFV